MGCPKGDESTESRSGFMVAARTITMMKPKNQHEPMDMRIPKGTALVALAASSLM